MKYCCLFSAICIGSVQLLFAQESGSGQKENAFDELVGIYQGKIDSSERFIIKMENNRLMLEITGQGKTDLIPLSGNRFKLNHVKIETIVQFVKDSLGNIQKLIWFQKIPKIEWTRIRGSSEDS